VDVGEVDWAFVEADGRNAASNTAASGRPERRQAWRNIFPVETATGRAFEPRNLIVISGRQ
jgi:hypothetical protein